MHLFKALILFVSFLPSFQAAAMTHKVPAVSKGNDSIVFKITFVKSSGEPQNNVFVRRLGDLKTYNADENGTVVFKHKPGNYLYKANVFFKGNAQETAKEIELSLDKTTFTVNLDSQDDLLNYRKSNQLFPIEGMVRNTQGEPIEGATVSIQGTGRQTLTDEIGLFTIDGDYNHPIVIRANGMNNQTLPLSFFLTHAEEGAIIVMEQKNHYRIYNSVENMPSYPGGMKALQQYLDKHLTYPEKAKKAKLEGVVVVQFIVEKDGSISSPRIARHLETTLDTIALNTVSEMPNWIPGSDYGTTVRCKYSIPVAFRIPKPKPILPVDSLQLRKDSLTVDSLRTDSLAAKALLADSLKKDSLKLHTQIADSLQNDSTRQSIDTEKTTVKAKKRNIFVRFFRWLFGIERRARKRAEKAEQTQFTIKASQDSIKIEADSIDIDIRSLKIKADSLVTDIQEAAVKTDTK